MQKQPIHTTRIHDVHERPEERRWLSLAVYLDVFPVHRSVTRIEGPGALAGMWGAGRVNLYAPYGSQPCETFKRYREFAAWLATEDIAHKT